MNGECVRAITIVLALILIAYGILAYMEAQE